MLNVRHKKRLPVATRCAAKAENLLRCGGGAGMRRWRGEQAGRRLVAQRCLPKRHEAAKHGIGEKSGGNWAASA
jgi:hypothetical protein